MTTDLPACIHTKLRHYFEQLDGEQVSSVHKMVLREAEAATIEFVLEKVKHNQSAAARVLGLNRGTLKKKIQQYKL